jgi:hypothetical protein
MIDWLVAFHAIVIKMCVEKHWLGSVSHHPRQTAVEHCMRAFLVHCAKYLG